MNLVARAVQNRIHYGWIAAGLVFIVLLCAAGVRSMPGVLILPLERAFGWDRTTISSAIAVNLVLFGLIGPFAGAAMQRFGIRRAVIGALALLATALALSSFMTQPWHLVATWGLMFGIGAGMMGTVLGATVVARWFTERRGVVMGALTASTAAGQLIFLPVLAAIAAAWGWIPVTWTLTVVVVSLIPLVAWLMVDRPAQIGLRSYGAKTDDPAHSATGNPITIAFQVLGRAVKVPGFWILFGTFFICGLSTNGLIGTHFIAFCSEGGMPEVAAAGVLAAMGIFNMVGTTLSGWLSDRYDNRWLLFWYYGLRGLSLLYLPFADLTLWGLGLFALFYGLDWIATVPPTMKLTTDLFGPRDTPIVFGWIFTGHQIGAGLAAAGGGWMRSVFGAYTGAFLVAGAMCGVAALAILAINHKRPEPLPQPA
jgi:MFS family permease